MPLALRPALPQDEPFLYQLIYENLYEQLYAHLWQPHIREPLLKMQIEAQRGGYAAMFPNAEHAIIVLDDRAVGHMILDRGPEIHHLVDIVIESRLRGKGIGTVILRAVCTEAEMLRRPVRLSVNPTNRAKGLYQRLGFQLIEDNQVTWLMERTPGAGMPPGVGLV